MADNLGVVDNPVDPNDLPAFVKQTVFEHVKKRLEKTDLHVKFETTDVYIVSFTYVLGNYKALVSTTLPDGRYYEVTCNKAKTVIYIDTYLKVDNVEIDDALSIVSAPSN